MVKKVIALVILLAGAGLWWCCKSCHKQTGPSLEQRQALKRDEWWGPKELQSKQDISVRPFQIKFGDGLVKDLKDRLINHRPFIKPLEGVGFEYGFNSDQLDSWINYWAEKYPFAAREKFLNQFPHFKTNIQGLDIHFIRVKPQVAANVQVLPLLMMHGWPGSVREFYEVIPLLTKPAPGYDFAFEVIVPSLPGYGFSDAAVRPGLGQAQVAVIMSNLMQRLGFKKYYIQGGDWGAMVASVMATIYPEEILGHHTNMAGAQTGCGWTQTFVGAFIPSLIVEPHLADRMYPLSSWFAFLLEEMGYSHIQASKPDTVGVALSDSPIGLLAYILEKFSTWTVSTHRSLPDGGLISSGKFTQDQLLDNLMIYWTSNSITTSMRLYAESMSRKHMGLGLDGIQSPVPTWALQAKYELAYQPPGILRTKYTNLVNVTVIEDGGHFVAFELPLVFAKDVFRAVRAFRQITKDKSHSEL